MLERNQPKHISKGGGTSVNTKSQVWELNN